MAKPHVALGESWQVHLYGEAARDFFFSARSPLEQVHLYGEATHKNWGAALLYSLCGMTNHIKERGWARGGSGRSDLFEKSHSSLSESTNQAQMGQYCPRCLGHHTSSEVVKVIANHSANCWQYRHQATQWVGRRLLRTTWPRVCVCLQSSEMLFFSIGKHTHFL